MPYSDQDGRWYSDRRPEDQYDTWKSAAEAFVKHVEVYLYDKTSPFYFDPGYIGWCINQYDTNKVSSGHAFNKDTYVAPAAAAVPVQPDGLLPADTFIGAIPYAADAKASTAIDTGPADPGSGAVATPPAVPVPDPVPVVVPDPVPAVPDPAAPVAEVVA